MIETVSFKNFKALRDVTIPLERFTVLVGPNASGKTSVLQGLSYPRLVRVECAHQSAWSFFKGERSLATLRSHGATDAIKVHGKGSWAGKPGSFDLVFEEHDTDRWAWFLSATYLDQKADITNIAPIEQSHLELIDKVIPPVDLLRLDANKLARPSYSAALVPRIEPDGDGLAAVLADMLISRADDFRRIEESLRAVIPSAERIRLERAPVRRAEQQQITINGQTTTSTVEREYVGHRVVFDMRGASNLPAHAASEGTLITLGILTAIMSHKGAHLVLIDDLERAIHPRAIADLTAQLRRLLDRFPDLQIVATSHSPYLVDHLEPREVRLMIADDTGAVRSAPLDDHPNFERWKEFMQPGEIWSMVGEEWVRDRSAQPHA